IPPSGGGFNYPKLTAAEQEDLLELAGKFMDSGMNAESADLKALGVILERRKTAEEAGKKDPFRFLRIGDLPLTPPRWLVTNFLETGSFCEIFGDPGCGKSFLVIELAAAVSTATPFFGMEIKMPGSVYYLAAEGKGGLLRRFRAWSIARAKPLSGAPLFLNETPLFLVDEKSTIQAINALKKMTDSLKTPPALIILDTWSRNLGGDDSSPEDAAQGVAAVDKVRSYFPETVVVVIHHSGNGIKDRSRGWSGLRAAVDTEFLMTKAADGVVRLSCTKNKEGEAVEPMAFTLAGIDLGITNEDGEPVYSAVLSETDYVDPPSGRQGAPEGKNQSVAFELLKKAIVDYSPLPVPMSVWRDSCWDALGNKNRFYDIRDSFIRRGKIQVKDGSVSLV
ncbi:MAG: helicase RepA family protein, partial [Treponema sp.]|nr:helicase RepA family protein [Treponema sp.]